MNARISPAVQNREDDGLRALDQEVHEVGKATEHGAMNVTVDSRVHRWVVGETIKEIGDRSAEVVTKAGLLLVVPVLGVFEVAFSQASNDDVVLHRLERRSATSLHGDSAAGFLCRSSNRRSSSRRCESDSGSAAVLASSATVSQIAVTSSILSSTLKRLASSRRARFMVPSIVPRRPSECSGRIRAARDPQKSPDTSGALTPAPSPGIGS